MTSREEFLQMKIEHYLQRGEECCAMARYPAARRMLDAALALDQQNSATLALGDKINREFSLVVKPGGDTTTSRAGQKDDLIVVVDQDERVLTAFAGVLVRHGFRFAGAATYEEAVELLSLVIPDIIVSEVNFDTGARGFDLFLWMRTNSALSNIPFLFHATRIDRDVMIAGRRFGIDDFLVKPVDGELLAAAATTVLHRRRAVPIAV
jgi:PleD family two-component response regulator